MEVHGIGWEAEKHPRHFDCKLVAHQVKVFKFSISNIMEKMEKMKKHQLN